MAKVVSTLAKQVMQDRYAGINGPPSAPQSLSVDDSTTLFTAATTSLGAASNRSVANFDSITRSGSTLTFVASFSASVANFRHRRIAIHNLPAVDVSDTSASFQMGHDQQDIQKNSQTGLIYTMQLVQS